METYLGKHLVVIIAKVLLKGLVVCCVQIFHKELGVIQLLLCHLN